MGSIGMKNKIVKTGLQMIDEITSGLKKHEVLFAYSTTERLSDEVLISIIKKCALNYKIIFFCYHEGVRSFYKSRLKSVNKNIKYVVDIIDNEIEMTNSGKYDLAVIESLAVDSYAIEVLQNLNKLKKKINIPIIVKTEYLETDRFDLCSKEEINTIKNVLLNYIDYVVFYEWKEWSKEIVEQTTLVKSSKNTQSIRNVIHDKERSKQYFVEGELKEKIDGAIMLGLSKKEAIDYALYWMKQKENE